mgnify:CR=1 FL=1
MLVHRQQESAVAVLVRVPVALAVPFFLDDVLLEHEPLSEEVHHEPCGDGYVMALIVGVAHENGAVAVGFQDPIVLVDGLPELSEEHRIVIDAREIPWNPALCVPDHVGVRRMRGNEVYGTVA